MFYPKSNISFNKGCLYLPQIVRNPISTQFHFIKISIVVDRCVHDNKAKTTSFSLSTAKKKCKK